MSSFIYKRSNRKRFFLLAPIMFAVALFAAACGSSGSDSDAVSVGLVFDVGGRGDQSFNDSAYAGLEKARDDLGVSISDVSPNSDGSNRAELLNLQAENKDLVLGIGFLFGDSILAAAKANPDVYFGIVDGGPADDSPSNLAHLLFAEHEGSYLVGYAAGLNSNTNKIGFIGGVRIPLIQRFEAGFVAGVAAANPNATVDIQYITEPPDFAGFNDPAQAKVIAAKQYEDGADVIYHAAGGSGAGLFEAAKEQSDSTGNKVWAIGVDSDQYLTADDSLKEYILTSMLKRVDTSVFSIINDVHTNSFNGGPNPVIYDLSVDGVGYSTSGGFLTADNIAQLEEQKAGIINGSIPVPSTVN